MVTRSKAPSLPLAAANQTPQSGARSGSQKSQTANQEHSAGSEVHGMASGDIIDIQQKQRQYKQFNGIIDYLQGKTCKVPKNLGININRFMLNEELLCISSFNAYGKLYMRICIPPDLVQNILQKAHITTGYGAIKK